MAPLPSTSGASASSGLFWMNCTAPESTCTKLPFASEYWLGGKDGACDAASGMCLCPAGTNGLDLIGAHNDCHVAVATQNGLDIFTVVFASAAAVLSAYSLCKLLSKWKVIGELGGSLRRITLTNSTLPPDELPYGASPMPRRPSQAGFELESTMPRRPSQVGFELDPMPNSPAAPPSTLRVSSQRLTDRDGPKRLSASSQTAARDVPTRGPLFTLAPLMAPRGNLSTKDAKSVQREVRKKRFNLAVIVCAMLYASSVVAFEAVRIAQGIRFEQAVWYQLLILTTAIWAVITSIWSLIYAWYVSMPDLVVFINLFPSARNSFLVKYPSFVHYVAIGNSAASLFGAAVLLFIVPLTAPWAIDTVMVTLGLIILACVGASMVVTLELVAALLTKFFREAKRAFTASVVGSGTSSGKAIDNALRILALVRWVGVVCGALVVALCMFMAFAPVAKRNFYVLVPLLLNVGCIFVAVVSYTIAIRWKRSGNPARSSRHISRPASGVSAPPTGLSSKRTSLRDAAASAKDQALDVGTFAF